MHLSFYFIFANSIVGMVSKVLLLVSFLRCHFKKIQRIQCFLFLPVELLFSLNYGPACD